MRAAENGERDLVAQILGVGIRSRHMRDQRTLRADFAV